MSSATLQVARTSPNGGVHHLVGQQRSVSGHRHVPGHADSSAHGGNHNNGMGPVSSGHGDPPISNQPPAISESERSHHNATVSLQVHATDAVLVLPKFKKNQRKINHALHDFCCDRVPPGRQPASAEINAPVRNALGLHAWAAINVGTRDHMEDRHRIAYGRPDGLLRGFFGVFDGHGGEEASHYTHLHLSQIVTEQLMIQYRSRVPGGAASAGGGAGSSAASPAGGIVTALATSSEPSSVAGAHHSSSHSPHLHDERKEANGLGVHSPQASPPSGASSPGSSAPVSPSPSAADVSLTPAQLSALNLDYKSALSASFDLLEAAVLHQSRTVGCKDGTTVTCVLATDTEWWCANTGDSRTVLCRDGSALALSHDHKPSLASERSRIEAAGGTVRAVMIDRSAFCCIPAKKVPHGAERLWPGGFSVSRAVGDIDFKDLRRKKANVVNVLIHKPDVTATARHGKDQFIILASDGLWDVMSNQQAVEFVLKEVRKRKREEVGSTGAGLGEIAQKLADHAYSLGSEDNITAMIVFCVNNELPFKS